MNNRFNENLIVYAFRYCLGRRTYAVSECTQYLIENWDYLSERVKVVIERDLLNAFEKDDQDRQLNKDIKHLGFDCDREQWEKVKDLFEQ